MKIIIAGAGNVGKHLVERLSAEDHSVVLIDLRENILEQISATYDIQTITGTASGANVLELAGVETADIIVAATDSDETNVLSCILAGSLNGKIRKIARVKELVTSESSIPKSIAALIDQFINPDVEAARSLTRSFEVSGAKEVIDIAGGRLRVVGLSINESARVVGKKLREIPRSYSDLLAEMRIVGIVREGQLIIPRGEDQLLAGDTLYISVQPHRTDAVFELANTARIEINNVIIFGGTGLGKHLAKSLAARNVSVKIIEPDPERCARLAAELHSVLVLEGEGMDTEILRNEGVAECDAFVAVTDDDEDNILSVLLAKKLGAKVGAVSVTKPDYLRIVLEIGIDLVVNPRIAAAASILKYVRGEDVTSVFSTQDDSAEMLDVIVDDRSKVVNTPLSELKFPPGVIVAAVYNDREVTIPTGATVIAPGEHVVFFANRLGLPKLEKMLRIKSSLLGL